MSGTEDMWRERIKGAKWFHKLTPERARDLAWHVNNGLYEWFEWFEHRPHPSFTAGFLREIQLAEDIAGKELSA